MLDDSKYMLNEKFKECVTFIECVTLADNKICALFANHGQNRRDLRARMKINK